ncbi:hypothetical protein [Paenibacillus sp. IHB B 3415]|uniref:hypothetical protein n=1 Tax=Paenibacillus sp. IHB B 3415 TaxID=867080 RepID=UPI000699F8C9|nr:hypothetical protein [Paenibacillus sp. IHB B 3415]
MKKKILVPIIAGFTLLLGVSGSALATTSLNDSSVSGGWSEEEGYFSTSSSRVSPAAEVVMIHDGWVEKNQWGHERAACTTWWKDTYHYSRARMEGPYSLDVTDSGRQWGYVDTSAVSPYADAAWLAKTYYGKDG